MDVRIDEIADGVYRLSSFVSEVAPPAGFTFNQFLVDGEQPMLFHCGHRAAFDALAEAVARLTPLQRLAYIGFGHVEADECGAMNRWLAAAPQATVVHGALACNVSLNDLVDRQPRPLGDGEVLDLGGKRLRWLDTPHVPHGWEAGCFYEETAGTLLCGDLFTHVGQGPALTESEVLEPALAAEAMFGAMTMAPNTGAVLRRLAELAPRTLALMHGSSFSGDGRGQLLGLAEACERQAGRAPAAA